MRDITTDFAARLAAGVTTLAHVWRLTRRDGFVVTLTDHDTDLPFDGAVARSGAGLSPGVIVKSVSLAADSAGVEGALSSEALAADDLAAGHWDGARVDLWTVDWAAPQHKVHVFAGRLGEVRRGELGFHAELRGLKGDLEARIGRVYARGCDAVLGDARCGVALAGVNYSGIGTINEIIDARTWLVSGVSGFAAGWFAHGALTLAGGARFEIANDELVEARRRLTVRTPPATLPAVGMGLTLKAGCDKRFSTCVQKFANSPNFGGFPHLPGVDALIAAPKPGEVHDGGRRALALEAE
jgi:uncharacterized phage protein (TIGR02218 family)